MLIDKAKGCLIGLACGDAVGTTVEFKPRGSFELMTDMVGGGPYDLEKGQWTDDTSMALCLGYSLLETKGFNAEDQMNRYVNWSNFGYMSSNGKCFDIGNTVSEALDNYIKSKDPYSGPTGKYDSGNGCIMRLAPVPIFYHNNYENAIKYAGLSSRTTHGSEFCIDSTKLMCNIILNALHLDDKDDILENIKYNPITQEVLDLKHGEFYTKSYEEITGSGYVIESLETALWCFFKSNSFKEAILLAVNVGHDADTTAAICGQIAGAFYGYEGIPESWKESITMKDDIIDLATDLYNFNILS